MFWQEFISLFTEMNIVPAMLLVLGIILCIIEMFVPGFGVFGITGGVCLVGGIVAKMLYGGTVTQMFILIFLIFIFLLLGFGIATWSAKRGLISKTPLVLKETALPENYADIDEKLLKLIGKKGITNSLLRPQGIIEVDGKFYDAISVDDYLEKGVEVEVVELQGKILFVKQIKEKGEKL